MKTKILFFFAALLLYVSITRASIALPNYIDGCTNISVSGNYALNSSLTGANVTSVQLLTKVCILINSSNLTLDCAGYTITNNVTGNTTGILTEGSAGAELTNITIENCQVSNFTWDVYAYYSNSSIILNNTANLSANIAFESHNSSYINFTNNTAYNNVGDGFSSNNSFYNIWDNNTAYGNSQGFVCSYYSSNNTLIRNTAHNNTLNGFLIKEEATENNFTLNIGYNNSYYGFEVYDSSNNNFANNTVYNNSRSGFDIYNSNSSTFTNNTAISNEEDGFYLDSVFSNSFIDNTAYGNQEFGFNIQTSSGNDLTNNTAQENSALDLYIDPFIWSGNASSLIPFFGGPDPFSSPFFLGMGFPMGGDDTYCNNVIDNLTGSGGNPINYTNVSVHWSNAISSEIVLCNADGSSLTNITVHGSDIRNNGIILYRTAGTSITDSNSSYNIVGVLSIQSSGNNFTNIIAENDTYAGFGQVLSNGNNFVGNTQSASVLGGFISVLSNDTNFTSNTASNNMLSGFAILLNSTNNSLTNNTAYGAMGFGTIVYGSDFVMITGDHYYANNFVSFLVATNISLAPLNLSGVIFDNPLGNYENYTNISLNDVVEPDELYALNWSAQPPIDPAFQRLFHNKFITIFGSPEANIDNLIWHWTDAEIAGYNESKLDIMQYNGSEWRGAPAQSILNPAENSISLSNLSSFGVFGLYEQMPSPAPSGGGGGCSGNLKLSVEGTICPGNKVVILLADSYGRPLGAGVLVTLKGLSQILVEHTNSTGEVSFAIPTSGRYTAGGIACDYSFNYNACPAGCTSNDSCSDSQYCDINSGECKPVACACGQISEHSCHTYECCVDSNCNVSYTCVNHECKATAAQPECSTDSDCRDDQYCSDGKCLAVLLGRCGYVGNHAWHSYECCNNSDCQGGSFCINNSCVLYRIVTDPSGFVGSQHEVWVLPAGSYQLNVITPTGGNKTLNTDAAGHATFVLENTGLYAVKLIKEEAGANVTVNAVEKEKPLSTPPAPTWQEWCLPGAIIGIILLLVIIYVIYRRMK
jgi:parallel beta-helix repeat protein